MAKDLFHDVVKNALIKDGWKITDDPLSLKVGDSELYIDLGAERLIAAERDNQKIAVEVKSFIGNSSLNDFHLAVGQFINYRIGLKFTYPEYKIFLAIPNTAYETFFKKEFPRMVIKECQLDVLVYDVKKEVIITWTI
ncbi:XisH family protein [Pseudanabaena sp. FACHB-1277]|jgi:hypothetical protein|uniref:XisH family protein n=1 Tax=Pseudanabaena cinerea FACHB-1277 TaxID=2949581 RepID=A0A926USR7_9CYAN|nr:XisH family protein [Pseudanabaena cinerea]MBD2150173.1 XisH family protein [Pseudanabaena cinerea FACHB-1277]